MGEVTGREKPILFSGPMVKAILDGRKTQTRRVAKFVPYAEGINLQASSLTAGDYCTGNPEHGKVLYSMGGACWQQRTKPLHCPYGQPGTKLWVRETWAAFDETAIRDRERNFVFYRADDEKKYETDGKWRPSIFMPRWASRITLEITKVRVERVQQISEEDAIAEGTLRDDGLECTECDWRGYEDSLVVKRTEGEDWQFLCPRCGEECAYHPLDEQNRCEYRKLWDSINSKRGFGWDANPWVWVIEFQRSALNRGSQCRE